MVWRIYSWCGINVQITIKKNFRRGTLVSPLLGTINSAHLSPLNQDVNPRRTANVLITTLVDYALNGLLDFTIWCSTYPLVIWILKTTGLHKIHAAFSSQEPKTWLLRASGMVTHVNPKYLTLDNSSKFDSACFEVYTLFGTGYEI